MAALTLPEVQTIQAEISGIRSKRGRILRALQRVMETITKDRGYAFNVQTVSFDVKSHKDMATSQTPAVFIMDDVTEITRHAGKAREYKWFIHLFGVVRETSIFEFEEFISDIENCIYDNNTLCGEVAYMEIKGQVTDNQLFSELDGTHLYELIVEINYTRCRENPR